MLQIFVGRFILLTKKCTFAKSSNMKSYFLKFVIVILFSILGCSLCAQEVVVPSYKNNVKITLLSLGSGSCRVTYERAFSCKNSAELTIGRVGWGWDFIHHSESKGWLFKAAFKWNLIPMNGCNNWLAGFYVKPELVGTFFDYNYVDANEKLSRSHTSQWALMAECGYQVVWKRFVFDVYAGLGPSFGTGNYNNYFHSFMLFPKNSHIAFTSGFRIGIAF